MAISKLGGGFTEGVRWRMRKGFMVVYGERLVVAMTKGFTVAMKGV